MGDTLAMVNHILIAQTADTEIRPLREEHKITSSRSSDYALKGWPQLGENPGETRFAGALLWRGFSIC